MEKRYYTVERGQQIVISLLKAHGIKKVVASPGTLSITLVISMQQDPWFEMYSSVDERSAAYIACGLAAESGEPVVITCTGATASRNYMSGLTEAYYRKLPIIAITGAQKDYRMGHLISQNIDRRALPNDITLCSVHIPIIHNEQDEGMAIVDVNRALLECRRNGGGPVHINLQTSRNYNFSVKELPAVRVIKRITCYDDFPPMSLGRVVVFVSCHNDMSEELTKAIDRFCATYDAVVLCDHTSGYYGRYRIQFPLITEQAEYISKVTKIDTLIHIGEVLGNPLHIGVNQVWRVSEDGELRDPFNKLRYVFEMKELTFFNHYAIEGNEKDSFLKECLVEYNHIYEKIPDLPFSNVWIAQQLSDKIPNDCVLHLGIRNSYRSWNFFNTPKGVHSYCNVGGYGIDGNMSAIIGASLASPQKLFFGVFGDLSFFYDMNVLGNRHIGKNLRILLVNNGIGVEFKLTARGVLGKDADDFVAAIGHFGNKSPMLVKHYVEDLGCRYLCASTKEEFLGVVDEFVNPNIGEQSVVLECFTTHQDECVAVKIMRNLVSSITQKFKSATKSVIGVDNAKKLKKLIK